MRKLFGLVVTNLKKKIGPPTTNKLFGLPLKKLAQQEVIIWARCDKSQIKKIGPHHEKTICSGCEMSPLQKLTQPQT